LDKNLLIQTPSKLDEADREGHQRQFLGAVLGIANCSE
jgi:hypothetical protein